MSTDISLPGVTTKTTPAPAPDGMGSGLFASTDIETGEKVLHIQAPFMAILDTPRLEDTCSGCFGKRKVVNPEEAESNPLRGCTGCRIVKYCGKTCQAKDWKTAHSFECSIFQKLKPRVLPNSARAVLRMVLRTERRKYKPQELDLFAKLGAHVRDIRERNVEQWKRISLSSVAVKTYAEPEMDEKMISYFFAKSDLNSFNLTNALYDRIGLYLHPYAALMNHSCDYNSVVGFDGDELYVSPIRPIKQGEQIFISYIDTTAPYNTRQRELSERYYFDCRCSKCAKGTDGPQDSFLSPPNDPDIPSLETARSQANEALQSASSSNPASAIQILESAIHTLRDTSIWPISRQPYVSIRDELITSLLSANRFNAAFVQAAIRYTRTDPVVFPHEIHPIRQLHAWALAKLAIHLSQGVELNSEDISLERSELKYELLIWSILKGMVKQEARSCCVPSFKRMARAAFSEVHGQFVAHGIDPGTLGEDIDIEWAKVDRICRETLEREGC